jgi:dTDP-glucose 4,6-dehydratase
MATDRSPMNMGNPNEVTVLRLAETIRELAASASEVAFVPRPEDDPSRRCPDISLARETLGWEPGVDLAAGLGRTLAWAKDEGW